MKRKQLAFAKPHLVGGNRRLIRDYFAAKAMQSMAAHPKSESWSNAEIAHDAYSIADAMIAERDAS